MASDRSGFEQIVALTSSLLVRYAARIAGGVSDAEDIVQEAYMKAHRALSAGQFDGRSSVKTWLYRIVTRTAIDHRRSRRRREALSDRAIDGSFDGLASAESQLALRELSDWLSALPSDQRSALVLQAMEGLSNREISEILECSEGAVEQRLVRARATLREKARAS